MLCLRCLENTGGDKNMCPSCERQMKMIQLEVF